MQLSILIVFQGAEFVDTSADLLINIAALLFILPFFLFSATAGQWIDKYEKSKSIRKIKLLEVVIMLIAAFAFISGLYLFTYRFIVFNGVAVCFFWSS